MDGTPTFARFYGMCIAGASVSAGASEQADLPIAASWPSRSSWGSRRIPKTHSVLSMGVQPHPAQVTHQHLNGWKLIWTILQKYTKLISSHFPEMHYLWCWANWSCQSTVETFCGDRGEEMVWFSWSTRNPRLPILSWQMCPKRSSIYITSKRLSRIQPCFPLCVLQILWTLKKSKRALVILLNQLTRVKCCLRERRCWFNYNAWLQDTMYQNSD